MNGWLNTEQCANYIGMSSAWVLLQRLKKKRGELHASPPYHRLGRAVRYKQNEVDEWLADQRE